MSSITNPLGNNGTKPLKVPEMIMYALGFGAGSLINLGFSTYLTFFWTDIVLLPLAAVATIMAISRILDGVTDIVTGFLVDRTKSKYGKARPWLLRMAIPGAISMALLYYVPNFSPTGKIIYAFVTYNLVAFFVLTATVLPLQSMLSRITEVPKTRLTLNMMGMIVSTGATVLGNLFVLKAIERLGGGAQGYFRFFGMLGLLAACLYMVTFFGTRERVDYSDPKKKEKISVKEAFKLFKTNKWWLVVTIFTVFTNLYPAFMAINIYYMTWVMKDPGLMGPFMSTLFLALLVTLIVGSPIVPKIGKIKASFIGMFMQFIGNFLPLIIPGSVTALMVAAAFRGIGPALLLGTSLAFMCDVVEYGEWKTGTRVEGLIFSGSSMGGKIGLGLGGVIVAAMLAGSGYVGGAAVQPESAINAITFTFVWWHAFGSAVCTVILFFLRRLDKQMPQIMADLEERHKNKAAS